MYAVVDSTKMDAFSDGNHSVAIRWFESESEAVEYAQSIADQYQYGVEIMSDEATMPGGGE